MKNLRLLIILAIISLFLIFPLFNKKAVNEKIGRKLNIYVVYSPTCPHCHHLLEVLKEMNVSVIKILPDEFTKMEIYKNLSKYFSGVPFVFAKVNGSIIIIEGFPTKEQDVNGYYYGKDFEIKMCLKENGKPVYINNSYAFCNITGIILGNLYSLKWLINQCLKYGCEAIS